MSIVADVASVLKVSESIAKALVIDTEGLAQRGSGERLVGLLQRLEHLG